MFNLSHCLNSSISLSAGRLSYDVNPQKNELRVNVSDMLEDHNYNLRLCHHDFICTGTGTSTLVSFFTVLQNSSVLVDRRFKPCYKTNHIHTYQRKTNGYYTVSFTFQIKKEEPIKSAILQYSRPLPCLCIQVKHQSTFNRCLCPKVKPLILIYKFLTGMVCCHRCH